MVHTRNLERRKYLGLIEILNDRGFNILYINNSFILFTEFEPANPAVGIDYISVKGQDITDIIENAYDKSGYTPVVQTELIQRLSKETNRLREYSVGEPWVKYVAQ